MLLRIIYNLKQSIKDTHTEGQTKNNTNDRNVRMSNKRILSEILARKKKNRVFTANEQTSA